MHDAPRHHAVQQRAVVFGSGSDPSTAPITPADVEAASTFQVEYERELRADEHSFLTVVDAHYIAPDRMLEISVAGTPLFTTTSVSHPAFTSGGIAART